MWYFERRRTVQAALPGARSLSAINGRELAECRVVAGVEVAHARVLDEVALREVWRQRSKAGPVPLLLLVDDPEHDGALRALRPLSETDPVRVVAADDLLGVLERLPSMSKLHAVRELAEELDRLDQAGTPGLVVRGL